MLAFAGLLFAITVGDFVDAFLCAITGAVFGAVLLAVRASEGRSGSEENRRGHGK